MKELDIQNKRILFLCTGNSCRSQIAEGIAKKYLNHCTIESAGTNPESINLLAIEVMKEIDIDLSDHYSKSITEDKIKSFDIVITLCGDANDSCVNLNTLVKQHIHWDIMDPAKFHGEEEAKRKVFRDVRELIKNNIKDLKENTV